MVKTSNLKNIQFMTESQFNNLQNVKDNILYAVENTSYKAGFVSIYAGTTAPDGWLFCDGSAISRTTYADLFVAIGTAYGVGDGSTTFNLPNLSDSRFVEGSTVVGTYIGPGLPNITASADVSQGSSRQYNATGAFYQTNDGNGGNWDTAASCKLRLNASRSSSIYGASSTVQPKSLTMRFIIKY